MKIDVIIPTIPGREAFLERTLTSVQNVKLPEGFVFTPLVINEQQTAGAQRNIGLQRSEGDYIYYLDDDDLVMTSLFCKKVTDFLKAGRKAVFFDSQRWAQEDEKDMTAIKYDGITWAVGRQFSNYFQMTRAINGQHNPYPVGAYLLRSDLKHVQWRTDSKFGEDIVYNKNICSELCKSESNIAYVPETKHLVIRHQTSTTYAPDGMLWWKKRT